MLRSDALQRTRAVLKAAVMMKVVIDLPYSLTIEATEDPQFFGFYSTELEGFTGIGCSIEDCLEKARFGMFEHVSLLEEQRIAVPFRNPDPRIVIENEPSLRKAG